MRLRTPHRPRSASPAGPAPTRSPTTCCARPRSPGAWAPRIEAILRALRADHLRRGLNPSPTRLVFRGHHGGTLSRADLSRDVHKDTLQDAPLRDSVRLHDLLHTAPASWAGRRPAADLRPAASSDTPRSTPPSASTATSRSPSCGAPQNAPNATLEPRHTRLRARRGALCGIAPWFVATRLATSLRVVTKRRAGQTKSPAFA